MGMSSDEQTPEERVGLPKEWSPQAAEGSAGPPWISA
jgi:hypothetical protein